MIVLKIYLFYLLTLILLFLLLCLTNLSFIDNIFIVTINSIFVLFIIYATFNFNLLSDSDKVWLSFLFIFALLLPILIVIYMIDQNNKYSTKY